MNRFDAATVPLDGRVLCEASAGTGKTFAITTLVVRLLLERGLGIDRILVVTFTEAATAELRRRVRGRIDEALAAASEPNDDELGGILRRASERLGRAEVRLRLLRAREHIDEAAISTIHGFCQRTLRDSAFDTGMRFDAELTGDLTLLVDEVIHDAWVRLVRSADPELLATLELCGVSPSSLRRTVEQLLRAPETVTSLPRNGGGTTGLDDLHRRRDRVIAFKRQFLDEARADLALRKRRRGLVGFDDLLSTLAHALEGDAGRHLAAEVSRRFPVALVDEFQDTDPVQWAIFDRIWSRPDSNQLLLLIGDPKQAIYSFRGADVFAYLAAASSVPPERRYTMATNWRSDPSLVTAVSGVFAVPRPMLLPEIGYPEVAARPGAEDLFRGADSIGRAPLSIRFAARGGGKRVTKNSSRDRVTKTALRELVPAAVAADIAALLSDGKLEAGRAIQPGDVAVLTRTNDEAFRVQAALGELGIPAVVHGDKSVFESDDATELGILLRGVAEPSDDGAVRAALITPAIGKDANQLAAMETDPAAWERWIQLFRELAASWTQRGIMPMFRAFADATRLQARLLALPDGERRLTNVSHLCELLHVAESTEHLGVRALSAWLAARIAAEDARTEDTQIRLESDERAVQLTTVHKSKGLEFPIVYAPFSWDGRLFGGGGSKIRGQSGKGLGALPFHDPGGRPEVVLLSGNESSAELAELEPYRLAERERLAEQLRLLYVALTRARHRTILVWGAATDFETSALGYLFHGARANAFEPGTEVAALRKGIATLSDEAMQADLERLAERTGGIEIAPLTVRAIDRVPAAFDAAAPPLRCKPLPPKIAAWWRTASFSQLTAATKSLALEPAEGRDRDEAGAKLEAAPAIPMPRGAVRLAEFPRGPKAGNFFHKILETIDFSRTGDDDIGPLVDDQLAAYGYESRYRPVVVEALREILATPLDRRGLRLADVGPHERLNELEFHLPVAGKAVSLGNQLLLPLGEGSPGAKPFVTSADLAAVFRAHPSDALRRDYHERVRQLTFLPLEGYLKGYVDLIFVHRNRWYLCDYKTNHLGDELSAYARDRLPEAMAHGHYYLQYHLYALALHRWLARRVENYDYGRHFGGVLYLFVKGMSPGTRDECGVFFEKPPRARIDALSRLIDNGRFS